ncbi:hypothetical protein BD410DRAFT_796920 [Rickenella mellea]|uniref:Uncharacterized protein n=1 Tax=Rickenella mellea TaxID=50990 RepID=A0A4Y7PID6_9AGAM|nr:hypothetical protein BD410DRAFT_796920 [Rickenella mellea]
MSKLSKTIANTPQDPTTNTTPSRNQSQKCDNCGGQSPNLTARFKLTHPYTELICRSCREDGRRKCPPHMTIEECLAPFRKRNPAPAAERTTASDMLFDHENMLSSNNTEMSEAGGGGNGSIQTANVLSSSQTTLSAGYGYGEATPGGQKANDTGTASGNIIATTSVASTANRFNSLNTNSSISNETAVDSKN